MSFATPTALLLAGLALPIVLFYILKVRLRRFPVSTNLFWRQIYDEKPPRSIWQNLRHLMSLLAQLAILALLVLAIADPFLPGTARQARRIVLVMDSSASMQAEDVVPSRFGAAKTHARQLLSGLREQDQVAIVLAGRPPEVIVGMTGHVPTLRRAINGIRVSDRSTHLADAIELGRKLIGNDPGGQVVVLTDGCDDSWIASLPAREDPGGEGRVEVGAGSGSTGNGSGVNSRGENLRGKDDQGEPDEHGIPVHWELFATEANNVGITQFQTRRSLVDPLGYEILTSISNASSEAIRLRLEITLNDLPVDVLPLQLQPGEKWRRSLEKTSMEGGTLIATLSQIEPLAERDESPGKGNDPAGLNRLSVDDVAWAYLPPRRKQPVLLVTAGNFFLEKVFEANPLVELRVVTELPEVWPSDRLIVLHRLVPEVMPVGDVMVIDPQHDSELWQVEGTLEHPIVTEQVDDSPLMTHIRLDNVLVPEARKLAFSGPIATLAGTVSGDSIYTEVKRSEGRCLVLCVNLEQSDLAFRTAFPIMVSNALSWYAGEAGALNPSIGTDELVSIEMTRSISSPVVETVLISPSGERTPLTIASDSIGYADDDSEDRDSPTTDLTVGPFPQTGIWRIARLVPGEVETDVEVVRHIAVNLASERETNLRPPDERFSSQSETPWVAGIWQRPLWFYLAVATCLFSAVEWGLYQRRVIT